MKMTKKIDTKPGAQGDVLFVRIESIPADARKVQDSADGPVIVAHSETGHHHQFRKDSGVTLYAGADPFVCYLRLESPAELEHLRTWDTHESIMFESPGCFSVNRHREDTPEGWRQVED